MTGPVGSLVDNMLRGMSMNNETAIFITDDQRRAILKNIFATFYAAMPKGDVVFDTNRIWCARLPLLTELFPKARVICCVRSVPWILDSIERLIRKNKYQPSGISILSRAERSFHVLKGSQAELAWSALPGMRCAKLFAASKLNA